MKKLYVMVGVPGSGKSTWISEQNWTKDCAVISTDSHIEDYAKSERKTYSEVFEEFIPQAITFMLDDVIDAQAFGKDIIWDQTSTTVAARAKKLQMLPDYYKIAVVIKTPPASELSRRITSRQGKEVPWEVISRMVQQLESQPPTKEEGFDEIWYV